MPSLRSVLSCYRMPTVYQSPYMSGGISYHHGDAFSGSQQPPNYGSRTAIVEFPRFHGSGPNLMQGS
jgi:hypothetical protein